MKRPDSTPHDIWITCDDKQRQWILDQEAAANRITRVRNRIAATKKIESDEQHAAAKRLWEGMQ